MRTVRDLRELVNVSRLSFKESDDEEKFVLNYDIPSPFHSEDFQNDLKKSSSIPKFSNPIVSITSPVKSVSTNTTNNTKSLDLNSSRDLLLNRNSIFNVSYSLNSKNLLPPLKVKPNEENEFENESTRTSKEAAQNAEAAKKGDNFDEMLTYIDASVVSEWLNRANRILIKMHKWHKNCHMLGDELKNLLKYESFILFCNFWLGSNSNAKFDHRDRRQLLEMEYSILCDEITQAFQIGIDSQQITITDIHSLLHAVLREYPLQFLSFRGVYLILDYIETLGSNRNEEYKKILSDVKCRTLNKQYAQWILSIRSFALINLCWGIIKFYRNLEINKSQITTSASLPKSQPSEENIKRLSSASSLSQKASSSRSSSSDSSNKKKSAASKCQSTYDAEFVSVQSSEKFQYYLDCVLKHDFPDVLHYLILTNKCDPYKKDFQNRNLIFLAVINNKPKILSYLIKRWPLIDVNEECVSGNTPLHAAVNLGSLELVELILKATENDTNEKPRLNINKPNEKCMNSTALHLAVWNNLNEITIRLLQANADPYLKMNQNTNAFDLALENSNQVLYDLIKEYSLVNFIK